MAIAERAGLPVAVWVGSTSPHEVTLVETTLDQRFTDRHTERLIADNAYDSDPLDERLKAISKLSECIFFPRLYVTLSEAKGLTL